MIFRRAAFLVFVSFLLVRPSFAAPDVVNGLRLHWLGLKQISTDTNAAPLMKVWQLPQTTALVAQTLGKLSRWPGHGATNAVSTALRPLIDDLITSEFYVELSAPTNLQPSTINHQLSLAVRLPADRASLWRTNLAAASAALAGSGTPHRIEISRAGDWTLVGVDLDKPIAKTAFAARLSLSSRSAAHDWLEADLTPSCLTAIDSQVWSLVTIYSSLSHIHLAVTGGAGEMLTRETLDFSRPLEAPLPAWEIPTNLVHAPLTSFTAVRGIAPWLATMPAWQQLQLAPAPDQAYAWSEQADNPFLTCCAAPLPGASNQLRQLTGRLVQNANPLLATNYNKISFLWQTNPPGLILDGTFILIPFVVPAVAGHQDFLLGGLVPPVAGDSRPPPGEILHEVLGTDRLVYYQTEVTGQRLEDYFFIIQFFRVAFHKSQLPQKAAATLWLKNSEPLLGSSVTAGIQSGERQIAFTRYSTIGFTALELHLLADWLESPQFPRGLHTFLVPPDKM